MNNEKWDTGDYTKNFAFVHRYGEALLTMLKSAPGAAVLDLGCGNGALTEKLAERYAVIGLDASPEFLKTARELHPKLHFMQGDATDFTLLNPVDAVFSNAVFHWIDAEKQPVMLSCVYKALKPGGEFVFEMGGYGNNALIHGALAKAAVEKGITYRMPFYFPQIGEYGKLLEEAGFLVREAVLFDRKTELQGKDGLYNWMVMFTQNAFNGVPEERIAAIRRRAVEELKEKLLENGIWYADYVRLRMRAEKPL